MGANRSDLASARLNQAPVVCYLRTKGLERAMGEHDWQNAGARWQGNGGRLRLEGSSRYRAS
jgi:hypothetical protein